MQPYRLLFLGRPEVRRPDGTEAGLPFGKPLALLAYVALRDRPTDRSELAALLWPDSPRDRGRHSVRQALFRIRSELGDVLRGERAVELVPDAAATDVEEFEQRLSRGAVAEAAALWRGPFLDELHIGDAPEWSRWKDRRRSRLEARFTERLAGAGRRELGKGNPGDAARWFRQAVEIAPYSPARHRDLMETLLLLRRYDAAEAALRRAREELRDLDDGGEVRALAEALDRAREADGGGAARRVEPPLVGRDEEMAALAAQWRDVRRGAVRVAVVEGGSGVGKTRLAREHGRRAREDGAEVVWVKCSPGERTVEYGVAASLAGRLLGRPGAAGINEGSHRILRRLLPSLEVNGPSAGPEVDGRGSLESAALADALRDLVAAVAFESPVVLILDDLQWADERSLGIVSRIASRLEEQPCHLILILGSDRSDPHRSEIVEAVASGYRDLRIDLDDLDPGEVREAVHTLLGPAPERPNGFSRQLHDLTGGNPLFLVEVLNDLREEGHLRWGEDGWRLDGWTPGRPLSLPESVRSVMHERIARLPEHARHLAACLARFGGRASIRQLRSRSGLSEDRFVQCLALLTERHIVEWVDDARVDFAHDQLRDAAHDFPFAAHPHPFRDVLRSRSVAIAAVLLLLAVPAYLTIRSGARGGEPPLAPYGGGAILAWVADSLVQVSPGSDPAGEWRIHEPGVPWPRTGEREVRPVRTTSGEVRWFGSERSDVRAPPRVVEFLPDGSSRVVYETPGDDSFSSLSPDGRWVAVRTEDPSEPEYSQDLAVVDAGTGEVREVYANGFLVGGGQWSPDGRFLLAHTGAFPDTLMVVTPGGTVVERHAIERGGADWCGSSERLLVREHLPRRVRLRLLSRGSEPSWETLDRSIATGVRPLCSPDGSAVIYADIRDRRPAVMLRDLETGGSEELPLRASALRQVFWLPDSVPPVPEALEVRSRQIVVSWGETDTLGARIRYTSGRHAPASVDWTSREPSVASVDGDGTVYGNSPGSTWIGGSFEDWHRDSTLVRVSGNPARRVLLRDEFRRIDTLRWIPGGYPLPEAVEMERDPALSLRGDGRWEDGLISRETFALTRGATLEAEFRIRLTRRDRQRVRICLWEADPPPDGDAAEVQNWRVYQEACVRYPSGELHSFQPDAIWVSPQYRPALPDVFPTDDWVHVAIQLRTDGEVSYFVNRRHVLTSEILRENDAGTSWRVVVLGASVDTEAYVRNLTLWEGERYDEDAEPAAGR